MDPEELRAQLRKWGIIAGLFALAFVFYALKWRGALVVYVAVVGLLAVLAILIQSGRGGGLAASLGGLGGDSLLGARSATPIAKATYVMLGLFLVICMLTARLGLAPRAEEGGLRLAPVEQEAPALPAEPEASAPAPSVPDAGQYPQAGDIPLDD
jgi:preprotein translocase subunit SecG